MEIRLEDIVARYRQLLSDANHQIICYKIANEKLEAEVADLKRDLTRATEDPGHTVYNE